MKNLVSLARCGVYSESSLPKETLVLLLWTELHVMPSSAGFWSSTWLMPVTPWPWVPSLGECSSLVNARKWKMRLQCSEEKHAAGKAVRRTFHAGKGSAAALCGWVSSPALSCCASPAPLSNPLLCANLQPSWFHLCTHHLLRPEIPQQPRFSSDPSYGRNLR